MSTTRLLLLGAMRFMQPVHGYDLRREIVSWNAAEWANVAYGSIYHALGRMTEEGLLEVVSTDQVGRRPARTSYRITPQGETEYQRLLREHLWHPRPGVDPFFAAINFMADVPREEAIAALRRRIETQRAWIGRVERGEVLDEGTPRIVHESIRLGMMKSKADVEWSESMIGKLERGELP